MNTKSLSVFINEYIKRELSPNLNERVKVTETVIICGGKEVPFGSKEHIQDVQRTLDGLEVIKSHWDKGRAPRHIISLSCSHIKNLLNKLLKMSGATEKKEEDKNL